LPVTGAERHGLVIQKAGADHVESAAARRP
jgi:hypothetical protein